jgi:hypothetical protein
MRYLDVLPEVEGIVHCVNNELLTTFFADCLSTRLLELC